MVVTSWISAVAALAAAGCTPGPLKGGGVAAPMNQPVAVGSRVNLGGDSALSPIEVTRRELEGTWDLVAVESAPTGDAARVPVQATGTLVFDEFGNLTIDARTTDLAAPVAAREVSRMSFKGRAVIDVDRRELKLMDLTGNVNPDEVLAPERRRRFEISGGVLKLSSFDDQARVTAITTWRRRP